MRAIRIMKTLSRWETRIHLVVLAWIALMKVIEVTAQAIIDRQAKKDYSLEQFEEAMVDLDQQALSTKPLIRLSEILNERYEGILKGEIIRVPLDRFGGWDMDDAKVNLKCENWCVDPHCQGECNRGGWDTDDAVKYFFAECPVHGGEVTMHKVVNPNRKPECMECEYRMLTFVDPVYGDVMVGCKPGANCPGCEYCML